MIKNELQLMLRVERNGVRLLEFHVIVSDRSQPGQFQHGPLARVVSVLVGRVQVSAASVTAELVNGRVIRTVDGAVTVAVLRGKKKTQEHNIKKKNKWGGGREKNGSGKMSRRLFGFRAEVVRPAGLTGIRGVRCTV